MGQMYITLRHPQKVAGLIGCHRHLQGIGIGHPHILAGKPDQAPGDIQRILPAVQHPAQPVHRRIRIAVSHGLMQSGNQVIVLLPVLIV